MRIKFILPALTEATSPFFRPVKYSLFPPLGLATLAAYCEPSDELTLVDEHVETLRFDDDPRWSNIARAASHGGALSHRLRRLAYAAGWKKFEPLWDVVIRTRRLARMLPLLEGILDRPAPETPTAIAHAKPTGERV